MSVGVWSNVRATVPTLATAIASFDVQCAAAGVRRGEDLHVMGFAHRDGQSLQSDLAYNRLGVAWDVFAEVLRWLASDQASRTRSGCREFH